MKNQLREMFEVNPTTSNAEFLRKLSENSNANSGKNYYKAAYAFAAALAAVTVVAAGIGLGFAKNRVEPAVPDAPSITESDFDVWDYTGRMNLAAFKQYAGIPVLHMVEYFNDIDFNIKGIIGDGETAIYAVMEATAVNGFEFDENTVYYTGSDSSKNDVFFADGGEKAIQNVSSSGVFSVSVVNPQKAVIVYGINTTGGIRSGIYYKFVMSWLCYAGDWTNGEIPGVMEFTALANYGDCGSFETTDALDANTELIFNAASEDNKEVRNTTEKSGITIGRLKLTPLALVIEFTGKEDALEKVAEIEKDYKYVFIQVRGIFLKMKDGTKTELLWGDGGGPVEPKNVPKYAWSGSEVYSNGSKYLFLMEKPVDLNEVESIIIGDLEIPVA